MSWQSWLKALIFRQPKELVKPDYYTDLEWAVIGCTAKTLKLPVDQVNLNTPIPSEFVRSITMDVCLLVNQPFIIRGLSSEQTVSSIVFAFISVRS